MLVVTRRLQESVVMGPEGESPQIRVTIIEIREDRVRLGIDYPSGWYADREELWRASQDQDEEEDEGEEEEDDEAQN